MRRIWFIAFILPALFVACEHNTDAVDEEEYWWVNDPRFADIQDQIDVELTLQMNDPGYVALKPQQFSGQEARDYLIKNYGTIGYHYLIWHYDEFLDVAKTSIGQAAIDNFLTHHSMAGDHAINHPDCPCVAGCEPGLRCEHLYCDAIGIVR